MRIQALGVFLVAALAVATPAWTGERFAVLVGVTVYPELGSENWLEGPANDVALMRRVLLNRGFGDDHIIVLADGMAGALAPSRASILRALGDVTGKARRGDFVYLHFSGHGSQQPEDPARTDRGHKPDGMNEIFLPRDTGRWSESDATVTHAIVDYEMNLVITRLRNKGVFVWAVFDSCHSASMARGATLEHVRFRRVDPSTLGVSATAMQRAAQAADAAALRPDSPGRAESRGAATGETRLGTVLSLAADAAGFVAFYAAQTFETAPEEPLPLGAADRVAQGLFTFTLAQGITQNGSLTYRQLRDYVLEKYAAQGEWSVTPLMEGTALDAPIFGDTETKRLEQWPIRKADQQLTIAAGALNGLAEGAVLAVLEKPTAKDGEALGYLNVDRVGAYDADLSVIGEPPEGAGRPALSMASLPHGAYARLIGNKPSFLLTVAMPPNLPSEGREEARARLLLKNWRTAPPDGMRVSWVEAGQPADMRLSFGEIGVNGGARTHELWLLPPSGDLVRTGPNRTPSLQLQQAEADLALKLRDSLQKISRAVNLLRIASEMPVGGGTTDVEIQALLTRAQGGRPQPLPDGGMPKLFTDDVLQFDLHNRGSTPADVTLLFLGSDYGITAMYPEAGRLNRIAPGDSDTVRIQITADTVGIERMLAIVVAAEPNQPHADFSFLQQDTLPKTRGGASPLQRLYETATFGGSTTRGLMRRTDTSQARVRLFSWQTALPVGSLAERP